MTGIMQNIYFQEQKIFQSKFLIFISYLLFISLLIFDSENEIKTFSLSLSIEILLLIFLYGVLIIRILFYNLIVTKKHIPISIGFILILFFLFFDLLLFENKKALYEINFLILLFSAPIIYFILKNNNINSQKLKFLLIFGIIIKILIDYNVDGVWQVWDTVIFQGEFYHRLGLFGYESNTLAYILNLFLIFLLFEKKNFFNLFLIFLVIYFLFQTFSRSGLLISSIIILSYVFISNINISLKFGIILIFSFLVLLNFFFFDYLDTLSNYFTRNEFNFIENPRISKWFETITFFFSGNIFNIFFGYGFFKIAVDNTFVNLLYGRGIIGLSLYLYLIFKFYKLLTFNHSEEKKLIIIYFFVILISASFIEFFGQRKIILFFALLLTLSLLGNKKIEHNHY